MLPDEPAHRFLHARPAVPREVQVRILLLDEQHAAGVLSLQHRRLLHRLQCGLRADIGVVDARLHPGGVSEHHIRTVHIM